MNHALNIHYRSIYKCFLYWLDKYFVVADADGWSNFSKYATANTRAVIENAGIGFGETSVSICFAITPAYRLIKCGASRVGPYERTILTRAKLRGCSARQCGKQQDERQYGEQLFHLMERVGRAKSVNHNFAGAKIRPAAKEMA